MDDTRKNRRPVYAVSLALLSGAAISPNPVIAATLATVGIIAAFFAWRHGQNVLPGSAAAWAGLLAVAVLMVSLYESVGPLPGSERAVHSAWAALVAVGAVLTSISHRSSLVRRAAVIAVGSAVLLVSIAMAVGEWNSQSGFDVYRSHQLAGDALSAGENPYGDAVEIPNGSPHAQPGDVIVGYSYPPVVLISYGASSIPVDPRLVSLLSWLAVLTWVGVRAWRGDDLSLGVLVILATAPVWPVVWFAGWTEPMSIVLFFAAAMMWSRRPVASAVLLGVAMASKQYFIFLAPLLLVAADEDRGRRATIALTTAGLTVLPALLIDARAYFQATVFNLADIGFRPDTQSLSGALNEWGIHFQAPNWVWISAGILISGLIGRGSIGGAQFMIRSGIALGAVFLIGQAFPNYWYLVMALIAGGWMMLDDEVDSRQWVDA